MGIFSLIQTGKFSALDAEMISVSEGNLQRDPFAPNYRLLLSGSLGATPFHAFEMENFISSLVYEDNSDQFDSMEIVFENQIDDAGGGQILSLIDSQLLSEGTWVELELGYGNSRRAVGTCQIVRKLPSFPASGSPGFTIICYDALYRMSRTKPTKGFSYKGSKPEDIVKEVGRRHGFIDAGTIDSAVKVIGDSEVTKSGKVSNKKIAQNKKLNDYRLLKKLADINGMELFSRFDTELRKFVLYFQRPAVEKQKEILTFVYGDGSVPYHNTLLSFDPDIDAVDQGGDFEVFARNSDGSSARTKTKFIDKLTLDEQKIIKEEQSRRFTGGNVINGGELDQVRDGGVYGFKAFGRSFLIPPHKRFKTEAEARSFIIRFIEENRKNFITGAGQFEGNEILQSRQVHNLEGLGNQCSGKYFLTQVRHAWGRTGGYKTDFSARKTIDDVDIQAPPTLDLSDTDLTIRQLKGF